MTLLSLGDCNTLGISTYKYNAYPEKFANSLGMKSVNCGYTMSTTREGKNLFFHYFNSTISIITIQYGLVDSWQTFKYSPYVLYYPDNFLRKIARKVIKKYKKICKYLGLNKIFGTASVVPINEYISNLRTIIENAPNTYIILIDTIPNKDKIRNSEIKKYNLALDTLAKDYPSCARLYIYDIFEKNYETFYADDTHMNNVGYEYIKNKLLDVYFQKQHTDFA